MNTPVCGIILGHLLPYPLKKLLAGEYDGETRISQVIIILDFIVGDITVNVIVRDTKLLHDFLAKLMCVTDLLGPLQ